MQVTLVRIKGAEAMRECPEMTPEMLAAVGARYSRDGEGLKSIMDRVAGLPESMAIDSIFKMVDYGHQSIADMVPVAMFIDRVSMYLTMLMWKWCPTASGQEMSTRYVEVKVADTILDRIEVRGKVAMYDAIDDLFKNYATAKRLWDQVAGLAPEMMNLPKQVLEGTDEKTVKQRVRMQRNFSFDRSRHHIPLGAYTNFMMLMPARGWVQVIQRLMSYPMPEAEELGLMLRDKLQLVAPRLVRHARPMAAIQDILLSDLEDDREHLARNAEDASPYTLQDTEPFLITEWGLIPKRHIVRAMENHRDRYDGFGDDLCRVSTRFGWRALPIAEIRDFNRHRTGHKSFQMIPIGAYFADDEIQKIPETSNALVDIKKELITCAERSAGHIAAAVKQGLTDWTYPYMLPMGAQCSYEHLTTANHFLYQCQLRTGVGAHPYYAAQMRKVLELWYREFPESREFVKPGTAEPE